MKKFKTDSKRLLDLMINSIYTNREIFLRELLSNASDAIDKLYFRSLTDRSVSLSRDNLAINLAFDKDARTITVSDNGIGMSREELDTDLGTIAHSGSLGFLAENETGKHGMARVSTETDVQSQDNPKTDAQSQQDEVGAKGVVDAKDAENAHDIDIIGQFGVGFYSSFMVARYVRVVSRAYDSQEAYVWESDGKQGYAIKKAQRSEPGTDVILTLKPDTDEEDYSAFLSEYGLKNLVKKYSNYVRYPILMEVVRRREKQRSDGVDNADETDKADATEQADVAKPADATDQAHETDKADARETPDQPKDARKQSTETADASKKPTPEYEDVIEIERLNSMTPIWKRLKGEVSDEEYNSFYQSEFHDFSNPARRITLHAEGTLSFDALLFIPGRAPFDLYSREYTRGLALYTSNVLIMEKCEELIPEYFGFVRGVVDSADLTLNISRETLQHNHQLRAIAKRIEKKIKSDLANFLAHDREGYETFFAHFGRTLKYGIYADFGLKKELLADLLMFYSARQEKMLTLREYLDATAPGQSDIYYAVGDSLERLKKLPIVTSALARGYDVLLGDADIDEFVLTAMGDYGADDATDAQDKEPSHALKNIAAADIDLSSEEEKQEAAQAEKANEGLFTAMAEALEGSVQKVVASSRLTDAPACVSSEGPISLEMEKVLAHMPANDKQVKAQRVLEINTKYPVFEKLRAAFDEGHTGDVALYAKVLYGQALLVEGIPLDDPVTYAQYICELL
ncbi:MAG: molecular chaperone HtpG [Coriobacteriales bacterium]|jgi:molecular chaperone HtpG|nr:molecular chaperone HtpG [Coriobacteriales bacterium]